MSLNLGCGDVNFDAVFASFDKVVAIANKLFVDGAINNQHTTIQQIALARELIRETKNLGDEIQGITAKVIICQLVANLNLEPLLASAEKDLADALKAYDLIEEGVETGIDLDAIYEAENPMQALDSAINAVFDPLYKVYESQVERLKTQLRQALRVLEVIGCEPTEIDKALAEVQFEDSIRDYILKLFENLARQSLERL